MNLAHSLKQIPVFADLPVSVLESLANQAKTRHFEKCTHIITEGDTSQELYILLRGKAKAVTHGLNGQPVDLLLFEPGDYFGEMALLTHEPRAASVVTLAKTTCAVIERARFTAWLKVNPDSALDLTKIIAEKVAYMREKTEQLQLAYVYAELVKFLKSRAELRQGYLVITDPPKIASVASSIGVNTKIFKKVWGEVTQNKIVVPRASEWRISMDMPEMW